MLKKTAINWIKIQPFGVNTVLSKISESNFQSIKETKSATMNIFR